MFIVQCSYNIRMREFENSRFSAQLFCIFFCIFLQWVVVVDGGNSFEWMTLRPLGLEASFSFQRMRRIFFSFSLSLKSQLFFFWLLNQDLFLFNAYLKWQPCHEWLLKIQFLTYELNAHIYLKYFKGGRWSYQFYLKSTELELFRWSFWE